MTKSHHIRPQGRPGMIRSFIGILCVMGLAGGAAVTFGEAKNDVAPPFDMTAAQVMANLAAPPPPDSFAVAQNASEPLLIADPLTTNAQHSKPQPASDQLDCVARLDQFLSPILVSFDMGSADISTQNVELLRRIGDKINACDDAYVMIAGHADGSGEDDVNLALSWERADRALNRLLSLGVNPAAVEAIGFGARAPMSQGSDEEDAADRRVDFRVMRKP